MLIEFDSVKSERNSAERGLPFDRVADFDFPTALIWPDKRFDYPEQRWLAIGWLDARLHVLCYCQIALGMRVISFRKANKREIRRYEQGSKTFDR